MEGLQEFWEMVDYVNWKEMITYDDFIEKCRKKLNKKYNVYEIEKFYQIYKVLRTNLKETIERYSLYNFDNRYSFPNNSGVLTVSDDGFWDLTAHIVGLGEKIYYKCMKNPEEILKYGDYKENFGYIFYNKENINYDNKKTLEDLEEITNITGNISEDDKDICTVVFKIEDLERKAINQIINKSIRKYDFKRIKFDLVKTYDSFTNEFIKKYDTVLFYDENSENTFFAVVSDINNEYMTVKYIEDDSTVIRMFKINK